MIEKQVFFWDIIGRGEAFSKHRFQVSGVRNDEHGYSGSLYFGLNPRLFEPFLKEFVIQAILTGYFIF